MGKSNIKELQKLIIEHLILLKEKINHYFPSLTKSADWVMLPFDFTDNVNELDLTNNENDEFIEMYSSFTTRILFNSHKLNIDFFWLSFFQDIQLFLKKRYYYCYHSPRHIYVNRHFLP